ncbi:uncharacterized protein TNCV_317781 [Trichonephila clavipes]|nr:uncharacterized protein TNCV_317781 [Trichonephila clavipes]
MAQRKHLDDFLRGRIIGRLECGRTQLEVSEELGIAQSVISRLWQRFQDDGNDITRMDWPAYSPDLNPIEHVWNMLGRQIAACQPPPTCLAELRRALLGEWSNIPQDQIDNWILSMPKHCSETKNDKESIYNSRNNSNKRKRVGKGGRKKRENRDIDTVKKEVNNLLQDFENSFSVGKINCQVIYSQFGLAIHQNDHQARRRFVEWAQNEIAVVPDFHKRILFSDEAHFWLNGYVNKQNCRIWSETNPQVYVKTPLHPEKLTVWCALWAGVILLQKR